MYCAICKKDMQYGYKSEYTNGVDICQECKIESEITIRADDIFRKYLVTEKEIDDSNIKRYNGNYFCRDIENIVFSSKRSIYGPIQLGLYFKEKEVTDKLRQDKKYQYNILERTEAIRDMLVKLLKKLNNPILINNDVNKMITVYALNDSISVFNSAKLIFDKIYTKINKTNKDRIREQINKLLQDNFMNLDQL